MFYEPFWESSQSSWEKAKKVKLVRYKDVSPNESRPSWWKVIDTWIEWRRWYGENYPETKMLDGLENPRSDDELDPYEEEHEEEHEAAAAAAEKPRRSGRGAQGRSGKAGKVSSVPASAQAPNASARSKGKQPAKSGVQPAQKMRTRAQEALGGGEAILEGVSGSLGDSSTRTVPGKRKAESGLEDANVPKKGRRPKSESRSGGSRVAEPAGLREPGTRTPTYSPATQTASGSANILLDTH